MRVGINEVIVNSKNSGTRQRDLSLLPELLRQLGLQNHHASVYIACDLDDHIRDRLIGDNTLAEVMRTPLPSLPTYQRILKGIPFWERQIRRDRIDVFHTTYLPIPRLSIPVILTINDVRFAHLPQTYPRLRLWFLRSVLASSLKRASRIIAISEDTKTDLVKLWNVREEKVDVVHIAADARFSSIVDSEALDRVRQTYNLGNRFILCVGHLEPRKNLTRLVSAYCKLRAQNTLDHKLVILGRPTFGFDTFLESLKASPYSADISLTGYVPDVDLPAIYALADLLTFPSLHEGFGIPVLEAMAIGTPVVTSNVSAMPEVAGDAAMLVDPYSTDSIANGIAAVLNDNALRDRLIQRGLVRARHFAAEKSAAVQIQAYEKVYLQNQERRK
jgi:glycosyltransferase involved in cell wall biosynthesis